ncbi:hypothetical protein PCH_Pc18g00370 [Penicillium rubens Wisconsin 54-1255]|uniref:Uncharacterized protein n=1 Tax=Penicillium rubens (strain ATCC 28089 / DSM 1075 / NRRL 1951 / Wisconsin 54-1255) TaxID=500485 RepID=B6HBS9_PENRW|nr:hypothetical protein PCH_Pc18g00370 [Penicillium rubens Wisconsin 54-1255]
MQKIIIMNIAGLVPGETGSSVRLFPSRHVGTCPGPWFFPTVGLLDLIESLLVWYSYSVPKDEALLWSVHLMPKFAAHCAFQGDDALNPKVLGKRALSHANGLSGAKLNYM